METQVFPRLMDYKMSLHSIKTHFILFFIHCTYPLRTLGLNRDIITETPFL